MIRDTRIVGYDVMRIIAAFMVVGIHSNVYFLNRATNELHWIAVMVLTALCVVSVPLFFMVSGAGNLVKTEITSVWTLYRVKIPKVFIPFVVWSCIYVCLRIITGKIDASAQAFFSLIWEPAYYQFWFMYSLLGMYLCIPIFQYLILKSSKQLLEYVLIFWMVSSLIFPALVRYIPGFKLSAHFNLVFLEGYWGYFFLGGYLRKFPMKHEKRVGLIFIIVGTLITVGGALLEWYFTPKDKYYGYVYCAYLLPGAAMMAVGAFMLLQDLKVNENLRSLIYYISGLTMGVFYIHMIVINFYEYIFPDLSPTLFNAIGKLIIVIVGSLAICGALKMIKPLRRFLL